MFFGNAQGIAGKLVEGWQVGGIVNFRTGRPISITSGIGTFHREAISGEDTVNLSQQLSTSDFASIDRPARYPGRHLLVESVPLQLYRRAVSGARAGFRDCFNCPTQGALARCRTACFTARVALTLIST